MDQIISAAGIKIALLSAVGTYGIIEAVKPMIKRFAPDSWPRLAVRLGALACGAAWGLSLQLDATGAVIGVCGAALSSTIVAAVKGAVRAKSA